MFAASFTEPSSHAASEADLGSLTAGPDPAALGEKQSAETAPVAAPAPARPLSAERVALFDLDLTLLDVNTGRLWVEKEFREGKLPFQIYLLAVYWFAKYAAGLGVDASEVARQAMALYGGQSDAAMGAEADAFWLAECASHLRPGAKAALAMHRARGERCVLCTASWQHIAAAARRTLPLDGAICSVIEVGPDGLFTGVVRDAYGVGKLERTLEWAAAEGVDLANATFYTDSYTDTRLMEAVGTPVAVCPDARLAEAAKRRGWRVEDWGRSTPKGGEERRGAYCSVWGPCGL